MADTYFSKKDIKNILVAEGVIKEEKWNSKRTLRKIVRSKRNELGEDVGWELVEVDDTQAKCQSAGFVRNKKMKPYAKFGTYKYQTGHGFDGHRNTAPEYKEEIRNANRSFKKSVRQEWKKELRKELEEIQNERTKAI